MLILSVDKVNPICALIEKDHSIFSLKIEDVVLCTVKKTLDTFGKHYQNEDVSYAIGGIEDCQIIKSAHSCHNWGASIGMDVYFVLENVDVCQQLPATKNIHCKLIV